MQERGDEAVSAVLGTLLLVGIAMLLAVSVFVAVRIFTEDRQLERKPTFAMAPDSGESSMSVVRAEEGMAWEGLILRGTCSPKLNGDPFPPPPGTLVQAGDILSCSPGDTLIVASPDDRGNAVLLDHRFPG